MPLDFNWTCGDIDANIESLKRGFASLVEDVLQQYADYLSEDEGESASKEVADQLYREVEEHFEGVRKTNEDMRSQSTYQIDNLEAKVEDLEDKICDLESEIESLNSELAEI